MAYVPVPKDLTKVKTKVALNLTKRQLIFFSLAAVVGLSLIHIFTGANWFVEGDIHACFDSFDHHVVIDLLRKRIDDEAVSYTHLLFVCGARVPPLWLSFRQFSFVPHSLIFILKYFDAQD